MDDSPMAEPAAEPNHSSPAIEQPIPVVHSPGPPCRVIGTCSEYRDLIELIRARVRELGITHETMDLVCGLPGGYSSKLLSDPPIRRLGVCSLTLVLGGLGLKLIVAEDAEQIQRVRPRLTLRRSNSVHAVNGGVKRVSGHR